MEVGPKLENAMCCSLRSQPFPARVTLCRELGLESKSASASRPAFGAASLWGPTLALIRSLPRLFVTLQTRPQGVATTGSGAGRSGDPAAPHKSSACCLGLPFPARYPLARPSLDRRTTRLLRSLRPPAGTCPRPPHAPRKKECVELIVGKVSLRFSARATLRINSRFLTFAIYDSRESDFRAARISSQAIKFIKFFLPLAG